MVQFNLLPDVKLKYIRATRVKHLITFITMIISASALGVMLLLLFTVKFVQIKMISGLDKDISTYSKQLKETKDIDRMLTVQNQLGTLTALHEKKQVSSRVYEYVSYMPAQASLNHLTLDFDTTTLTLSGNAQTLEVINFYATSLKNTTFTTASNGKPLKAYSDVVLSNFAKNDKGVTFTLTMKFDPVLFDVTQDVTLKPGVNSDTNDNVFTKA